VKFEIKCPECRDERINTRLAARDKRELVIFCVGCGHILDLQDVGRQLGGTIAREERRRGGTGM
jgi:uncharacterized Zn finger protein